VTRFSRLPAGEAATLPPEPDFAPGPRRTLIVSARPSVELRPALERLLDYPYGCVEQTMSRALPNAVVGRAFYQLGAGHPTLQADLPPKIRAGLQRLYGYQHNDGGWGWWYDDSTDLRMTAYVLLGLATTDQAGFDVDGGVIERGAEALRAMMPAAGPPDQAYGAYALALAGQPFTLTLTLTDALQLDLFSQAALAVAADAAGASLPSSPPPAGGMKGG